MYIFSGAKVIAEYANGAAPSSPTREYIYAGGALLARIDSSGTNYYRQDHLSNRMVTNSSGGVAAETGHFPFGESWYNATSDKLNFTTYEYDSESGNHYAMARYHVSRLGRLSSPDPLAGSTANPQSLNRYSYSINDPANVTDPSGASPPGSGCNTVEKHPTDKSQQTSGNAPSQHSDMMSGGDTDSEDADGDPPQNGCASRINPFGGGSDGIQMDGADITDLTGTDPAMFGTGSSIGNIFATGYLQGGFPIGQSNYYEQTPCTPDAMGLGLCSYSVGSQGIPNISFPTPNFDPNPPQFGPSTPFKLPCPINAASINAFLANTPLAGQGANFVGTGQADNLDPRLLVSIAGAESSFGTKITRGSYNALNVLYNGLGKNAPFSSFQSNIKAAGKSLTNPRNQYDLSNTTTMYSKYCGVSAACGTSPNNLAPSGSGLYNLNKFMGAQGAALDALSYPCK